jgi:hypothetical protein
MRKWITLLMTCFVGLTSYTNATMGDVNVFAGYRHDNLDLNHKVPSHDPFYKQKTHFKNIDIFQIGINARSTIGCNFYARAEATWGWVLNGDLNRSISLRQPASCGVDWINEVKHKNTFDEKYVYDANIAIGYPFYFCDCSAVVAPVIGYAVDVQDFSVHERGFDFDSCGDLCSAGNCCKHTFFNRWYGPFVGADFNYRPLHDCWTLYAAFEYHWGRFKAKRSEDGFDFDSCRNRANMDGWVVNLGADYEVQTCNGPWTVGLYVKFTDFSASKNRHHYWGGDSYDSDSEQSGRGRHSANWRSYAVNVEFGKQF